MASHALLTVPSMCPLASDPKVCFIGMLHEIRKHPLVHYHVVRLEFDSSAVTG